MEVEGEGKTWGPPPRVDEIYVSLASTNFFFPTLTPRRGLYRHKLSCRPGDKVALTPGADAGQ